MNIHCPHCGSQIEDAEQYEPLDFPESQASEPTPRTGEEARERIQNALVASEQVGVKALARAFERAFRINLRMHKTNRRYLERLAELGATPDAISEFAGWWRQNDWRGQQGDPARPELAYELWPRFQDDRNPATLPERMAADEDGDYNDWQRRNERQMEKWGDVIQS